MTWVWILLALPVAVLLADLLRWRWRRRRASRAPQNRFEGGGSSSLAVHASTSGLESRGRNDSRFEGDAGDSGGDGDGGDGGGGD